MRKGFFKHQVGAALIWLLGFSHKFGLPDPVVVANTTAALACPVAVIVYGVVVLPVQHSPEIVRR